MRQLLTLLSCLFFGLKLSAQNKVNPPYLQFGCFYGIGRTQFDFISKKGGLGYDIGLALIKKNKNHNRRLEMNLSYSTWDYKSDKLNQFNEPLSDTFYLKYRKAGFLDLSFKTNLKICAFNKYRLYLSGGLMIGTFMHYRLRTEEYLKSSNSLVYDSGWNEIKSSSNTLIGVQYGFVNEIPIGEKWVLSADLLILSKVTFEIIGASGPFKFQQLRIGFRKTFEKSKLAD